MQQRMKELEIAIKMKQEVISSLTQQQQKASGLAGKVSINACWIYCLFIPRCFFLP
jgi:hypothetical protein